MTQSISSFGYGFMLVLLHVVLVAIMARCMDKVTPVMIHVASAFISFVILCITAVIIGFNFWLACSVLFFCVSTYVFVFSAVYKSLSLRILSATHANGNVLSIEKIKNKVTSSTYAERVELLSGMGYVVNSQDKYQLTKKGKTTVKLLIKFREAFLINTRSLYWVSPKK